MQHMTEKVNNKTDQMRPIKHKTIRLMHTEEEKKIKLLPLNISVFEVVMLNVDALV